MAAVDAAAPDFNWRADRIRLWLSAATLAIHLAVAGRYDFFRDELYFIICGRHPAFGYVDQPPLVPLISALTQVFGEHLFLLRAVPALAAAACVFTVVSLARLLGARDFGALLAGLCSALAPMYLGLQTTLGTTTFEPFLWTLLGYLLARALLGEARLWPWLGVVIGVDLELKYELPIYLVPLVASAALNGFARALWRPRVALAVAIAAALALPSLLWQLAHGLPFAEMLHNQASGGKNLVLSPLAFLAQQLQVMNPLFAPVWLAGAVAPFIPSGLRALGPHFRVARVLSAAFAATFVAMIALHAKDYFVAPLYGSMFAVGAVASERWIRAPALRAALLAPAILVSAIASPLAMPILSPPALVAYLRALHLAPKAVETQKQGALPQTFADMFGWREMTAKMEEAVRMLPPDEQKRVVILAHNYGEAAAFQFYGRDLPPVVSGHNQYALWGPGPAGADEVIAFNRDVAEMRKSCLEARELNHFFADWVVPFEDDSPITLCRGPRPPLAERWQEQRFIY